MWHERRNHRKKKVLGTKYRSSNKARLTGVYQLGRILEEWLLRASWGVVSLRARQPHSAGHSGLLVHARYVLMPPGTLGDELGGSGSEDEGPFLTKTRPGGGRSRHVLSLRGGQIRNKAAGRGKGQKKRGRPGRTERARKPP